MKENRKRGNAKTEFDGLEVELRAGKRQLKGAPQKRLEEMILLVLRGQTVRKKFNVFLDKETHSGITHKVDWVEVQKICRETPGIGVIVKIGFIGTDQVWWCKIQIPVCISVDRHAAFLSIIKNIAEEKCSRTRTPAEVNGTGKQETAAASIQDVPPPPPIEEMVNDTEAVSEEAEITGEGIDTPVPRADEASSSSIHDDPIEEEIDASIPDNLPAKERSRRYRNIFFQSILEAFIRAFVEKAGGLLAPVSRDGLGEILRGLKLKNLNQRGAIRHLIERGIISKPPTKSLPQPCIWLTESARNMLIVKEADGDGLLQTISDLQRELEIAKGQIGILEEQNAEKGKLLLRVRENIKLRKEVFLRLGTEKKIKHINVLNGILDECDEFDENIVEQITQVVGE